MRLQVRLLRHLPIHSDKICKKSFLWQERFFDRTPAQESFFLLAKKNRGQMKIGKRMEIYVSFEGQDGILLYFLVFFVLKYREHSVFCMQIEKIEQKNFVFL